MGEFVGSNWFQRGNEFDLARLDRMFADYDQDLWGGLKFGLIQYSTEDSLFQLLIEHRSGLGFLLQFFGKVASGIENSEVFIVCKTKMRFQVDELDEINYPIGCFLPP
ncbi:MAG: hypothetical protein U0930_13135 [Pirellulales bacterium]